MGKRERDIDKNGQEKGRPVPPPEKEDPKGGGKHEKGK